MSLHRAGPVAAPEAPGRGRSRGRRLSEPSFAFVLNVPALLAIVLLVGYPIAYSAWLSLHRYNLKRPRLFRFIGLENYADIVRSAEFWAALEVTLLFTGLGVALVVALGVLMALLLDQPFPGRGFVRTMVLVPWAGRDGASGVGCSPSGSPSASCRATGAGCRTPRVRSWHS